MNGKNQFIWAIILTAILIFSGCIETHHIMRAKYIIGQVVMVGNEPFTNLAIQTSPTNIIILDCDNKTRNFLLKNQGQRVKIFYEKIDKTRSPNVIYVQKSEIISEEIQ
jgi:hypothetical protein